TIPGPSSRVEPICAWQRDLDRWKALDLSGALFADALRSVSRLAGQATVFRMQRMPLREDGEPRGRGAGRGAGLSRVRERRYVWEGPELDAPSGLRPSVHGGRGDIAR